MWWTYLCQISTVHKQRSYAFFPYYLSGTSSKMTLVKYITMWWTYLCQISTVHKQRSYAFFPNRPTLNLPLYHLFCTSYIHNNVMNISRKYQTDVMYISISIANSHQIPKHIPFFCTSYIHNNATNISRKYQQDRVML